MSGAFTLALSQFAKNAGEDASNAVRRVVLAVGRQVIERSPVDTGRFRANWYFSKDAPSVAVSNNVTAKAVHDIDTVQSAKAGEVFYISNNLPYAYRLEVLGATKARNALGQVAGPAGIVGATLVNFQGIVDKAVVGGQQ